MKKSSHKKFYITNTAVAIIVLILFYVAFFANNSENYLFPQLVIGGMLVLALLLWFETSANNTTQSTNLVALTPGLGITITYVLAMDFIGFYLSSIVAFFVIITTYEHKQTINFWRELLIKLSVSIVFVMVLYLLFAKILHVRMPEGVFF